MCVAGCSSLFASGPTTRLPSSPGFNKDIPWHKAGGRWKYHLSVLPNPAYSLESGRGCRHRARDPSWRDKGQCCRLGAPTRGSSPNVPWKAPPVLHFPRVSLQACRKEGQRPALGVMGRIEPNETCPWYLGGNDEAKVARGGLVLEGGAPLPRVPTYERLERISPNEMR